MSMLEDIKAAEKAADELKKEKTAAARTLLRDAQEEARKEADALVAKARGGSAEDRFGSRSKGP